MLEQLKKIARAEGVALSDEALALVAREAEGSLRDAQSLLDQVLAAGGISVDETTVREILGAADRRLIIAVADHVLGSDATACVRDLASLHAHGYDAQRFCRDLLDHFRNLTVLRVTSDPQLLADLPEAEATALAAQAERRSADDLQRFFRLLLETDEVLAAPARTVDPQLVLEMAVLRLATLPPLLPVDEILRRLEALGVGSAGDEVPASSRLAPATAKSSSGEQLWEQFLARVRDDKVSLYLALASGKLVSAEETSIRIGIENEAMRRDIARPETLARLGAIAADVWGRELSVEVGPVPAEQAADTPLGRARRRTEATLADPLVQAAVDIFGGEVRGVRDRRER
ncbi:MAG: hypothetical protein E6J79_20230 [Deltaproteobacteria bacterium]|nr:MAG: hypothetical protein E6J79_20230 [Deltaproteobacteria bacterium]